MQTDPTVPTLFAFCILNFAFREASVISRRISLWGPVVVYMAAIFVVSSFHQAPLPPGVSDKPAHAFGYMGLGFVIARALGGGLPPRITRRDFFIGLAIAVTYAASDEFHQRFVPGRDADLADLYADAVGSAIALSACWAWGIISPRSRQPAARSQQ
jgi:VanZ family protein